MNFIMLYAGMEFARRFRAKTLGRTRSLTSKYNPYYQSFSSTKKMGNFFSVSFTRGDSGDWYGSHTNKTVASRSW